MFFIAHALAAPRLFFAKSGPVRAKLGKREHETNPNLPQKFSTLIL